jgi:hypothetical protein
MRRVGHCLARLGLASLFVAATALGSCGNGPSNSTGNPYGGSGPGGTVSVAGTVSVGGTGAVAAGGAGGVGGAIVIPDAGGVGASGGSSGADACAEISVPATLVQVDMYLMFDASQTMTCAVTGGGTRWEALKNATQQFLALPASSGLGVGIQYFGLEQASCDPALYAKPAVEIAPLPDNGANLISSLNSQQPDEQHPAPLSAALEGAIDHARAWANSHPGHVVVVVLVTDAQPYLCEPNQRQDAANAIAAAGLAGTPSIRTYVIGYMPDIRCHWDSGNPSRSAMDGIAESGGTDQAVLVQPGVNAAQQFLSSIQQIQGRASLPCTYKIPPPTAGSKFDFFNVNVKFTSGQGQPTDILSSGSRDQCTATGGGWHYDNPQNPSSIELCPQTCALVSGDPRGKVDILLGCKPKGVPPPVPR